MRISRLVRKLPVETLVHIGANENRHFQEVTAFDCNSAKIIRLTRLIELHQIGKARVVRNIQMSSEHMDLIEKGIKASPLVSPEIQGLVETKQRSHE